MTALPPAPGFLSGPAASSAARARHSADFRRSHETGFAPVALAARGLIYGVTPDLTYLRQIIGGGMPVGCFGGKNGDHGSHCATGPVY